MYENLFQLDAVIQRAVVECTNALLEAQHMKADDKKAAIQRVELIFEKLVEDIGEFKRAVDVASPERRRNEFQLRYRDHLVWQNEIARELAATRSSRTNTIRTSGGLDTSQLFAQVLHTQDQAINSLRRSQDMIDESEETSVLCVNELARQKSVNASIATELSHFDKKARRVGKEVRWFTRNLVTDKLFLTIFCCALAALLLVIGLKVYVSKKSDKIVE
ncbi:QA-SNARE protein [Perkinsela sp. CCAP 1560/4]|nr:QA-SNARE protein [Perkinsela sp. CCAP 1560/4]|eukprot:KNH07623.1 QA-SNARE protein [Perkinsela sp. CCAP 1560/4]